jgi:hypothetical protein
MNSFQDEVGMEFFITEWHLYVCGAVGSDAKVKKVSS